MQTRIIIALIAATALPLAACADEQPVAPKLAGDQAAFAKDGNGWNRASVQQELAALRRLTAPFHNFEKAVEAGWSTQLTGCREHPSAGAMGYHYGNLDYVLDSEAAVVKPEALIYEPQKNGRLALVGIEYVVPFSFLPPDADPPTLFGQEFLHNYGDQVWMLHVWIWRHNPDGMFATWNPSVSCQYAPAE